MQNLVKQYLKEAEETVDEWEDLCIELADAVLHWCDRKKIKAEAVTIEPIGGKNLRSPAGGSWGLHQVILSGGLIHDAYIRNPMRLNRYLQKLFPNQELLVDYFGRENYPSEIYVNGNLLLEKSAE